jgi:hypothetical protein
MRRIPQGSALQAAPGAELVSFSTVSTEGCVRSQRDTPAAVRWKPLEGAAESADGEGRVEQRKRGPALDQERPQDSGPGFGTRLPD